jgi:hypothetical protein
VAGFEPKGEVVDGFDDTFFGVEVCAEIIDFENGLRHENSHEEHKTSQKGEQDNLHHAPIQRPTRVVCALEHFQYIFEQERTEITEYVNRIASVPSVSSCSINLN